MQAGMIVLIAALCGHRADALYAEDSAVKILDSKVPLPCALPGLERAFVRARLCRVVVPCVLPQGAHYAESTLYHLQCELSAKFPCVHLTSTMFGICANMSLVLPFVRPFSAKHADVRHPGDGVRRRVLASRIFRTLVSGSPISTKTRTQAQPAYAESIFASWSPDPYYRARVHIPARRHALCSHTTCTLRAAIVGACTRTAWTSRCGHCKQLAPTYEKVAKNLNGLVNVGAVDCEAEDNKALCSKVPANLLNAPALIARTTSTAQATTRTPAHDPLLASACTSHHGTHRKYTRARAHTATREGAPSPHNHSHMPIHTLR